MSESVSMLGDTYAVLADLWCSPQDSDPVELRHRVGEVLRELGQSNPEVADALLRFLVEPVAEEEYVDLFELDPRCALYLGSHSFDEPTTCAQAGVSDRNGYMIELRAIYGHMGLTAEPGELPDYLPLMIEFLSLTADSNDPIRRKLITEYMLPFLAPMRSRLEDLQSPYLHLLDALERVLRLDTGAETTGAIRV